MGTLLHSMFFLGLGMALFKTTEGYQKPYKDPFIYMRGGPIKERSLFDANGNIVQDNFQESIRNKIMYKLVIVTETVT